MKILVTGANGFIGKNLVSELRNQKFDEIFECDLDTTEDELSDYCRNCDFVFHLAGINRPKNEADFMSGNFGFTSSLLELLEKHSNTCTIVVSSSIQADYDNPYGKSKKAAEMLLTEYSKRTGAKTIIYRLPNVFGKWCLPNYNSVVATFCNNIAHNMEIHINDAATAINLVYIDDVVENFIMTVKNEKRHEDEYGKIETNYTITLGELANLIESFASSREDRSVPNMSDELTKKLYSTYLSYLPENKFSYPLKMNIDSRGSFTEILRTPDRGQVSVNISKAGITKGNHWHHTKNEKFVVVSGKGLIQFRRIDSDEIIEYYVSGEKIEVVDIPVGYTHNIINVGDTDMVTVMWVNEPFNPENPDTYFLEV